MEQESVSRIADLSGQLQEAVRSAHNREREKWSPRAIFSLEEPIASALIHHYAVERYFSDPVFYYEQTLRQKLWRWEHFPEDDAPLTLEMPAWLGHYPEYTFIGLGVSFDSRGVPLLQNDHPLTRDPNLRLLQPVNFASSGWMPRILRWYDDLSALSAGRLKVTFNMTWWRGCLDLAIQLRGYDNFLTDLVERPAFVHDLLEFLVEQRCRWWDGYYRHFGLPVGPAAVADDWINVPFISPSILRDFVLPRYLEIESYHGGITGIHSCGNQTPVQRYLLQIKSLPTFEVSPWTDLEQTLRNVPASKALSISLHPNDVLCATPVEMEARLHEIVVACQGRNYNIYTSGLTPIWEDMGEFIRRIRLWNAAARQTFRELRGPLEVVEQHF
jgi:hypothetical protein